MKVCGGRQGQSTDGILLVVLLLSDFFGGFSWACTMLCVRLIVWTLSIFGPAGFSKLVANSISNPHTMGSNQEFAPVVYRHIHLHLGSLGQGDLAQRHGVCDGSGAF